MPLQQLVEERRPKRRGTRVDASGWPILPATQLTIHRTSDQDEGSRQIICRLDGVRMGELLYGQCLDIEIVPGPHVLWVFNTLFWKTIRFEAGCGAHTHVTVWNRSWPGYYEYMMLLGPAPPLLAARLGPPGLAERDASTRARRTFFRRKT
jgi:hypothetical protein